MIMFSEEVQECLRRAFAQIVVPEDDQHVEGLREMLMHCEKLGYTT